MSRYRRSPLPHRRILDLILAVPAVDCQNRLMRVADRDLAMSMLYMDDGERDRLRALVGAGKGSRISQELERIERSRLDRIQYEVSTSVVIRALEGGSSTGPKSYFRPSRNRPTR